MAGEPPPAGVTRFATPPGTNTFAVNLRVTTNFWIAVREVTQAQYEAVMGTNRSSTAGASLPVDNVTWDEGPKWCGKTTTCEEHAKSILYMADPVRRERYLTQAAVDITELLKGEQPRLIDEWQDAPKFWDAIRFDVDHSPGWGHYILTGSAVPPFPGLSILRARERSHSKWC